MQPGYLVPVPSQGKLGGLRQEQHLAQKWGDDGGGSLISLDGLAPSWIVGVYASVIFPCTIKSRRRFLLAPAHPGTPEKGCKMVVCVTDSENWKDKVINETIHHRMHQTTMPAWSYETGAILDS